MKNSLYISQDAKIHLAAKKSNIENQMVALEAEI